MFASHTHWTDEPCHYVIATEGNRRAWLAGPYRSLLEADAVLPRVHRWALQESGDPHAARYGYEVFRHYNGDTHSILGEIGP